MAIVLKGMVNEAVKLRSSRRESACFAERNDAILSVDKHARPWQ
jgi:hypothetical protein